MKCVADKEGTSFKMGPLIIIMKVIWVCKFTDGSTIRVFSTVELIEDCGTELAKHRAAYYGIKCDLDAWYKE